MMSFVEQVEREISKVDIKDFFGVVFKNDLKDDFRNTIQA